MGGSEGSVSESAGREPSLTQWSLAQVQGRTYGAP